MKFLSVILIPLLFFLPQKQIKPKILIFSKTAGFRHESIEAGKIALMKLGQASGFIVDTTENAELFNTKTLKNYSAVIFLNTTGNVLNKAQEKAFEDFIRSGKGFVGIHAAADTEFEWEWYGKMVGGYFHSHPEIQEAKLEVIDNKNLSTRHLPEIWTRKDEWYNYKNLNREVNVLIKLNTSSFSGSIHPNDHPIAWYHEYEGGKAWYTGLGHTRESYSDSLFLNHVLGGIKFVLSDE